MEELLRIYKHATLHDFAGITWYEEAKQSCLAVAAGAGFDPGRVIGTVAVLSPRLRWEYNIEAARQLIKGRIYPGVLPSCAERGYHVLWDEDWERWISGDKVQAFFHNISNPADPEPVTVDVWTARAWLGDWAWRKNISAQLNKQIADDYRQAAARVGLLPCQFQAVIWVHIRRLCKGRAYRGQLSLDI